ncbi:MAG: type II toxin-antitoxin system Xre/ParS family antitoxin [Pseudomonadota bacterium]
MRAARTVEALLGGHLPRWPRTPMQWVDLLRQGISSAAVDSLASTLALTQAELAGALAIPERTLARRKKEGLFNSEESAKLLRLARVAERAETVFEDWPAALDWLKSPNAALGGVTPLSLMDTDIGAEAVLDTLGRIEHGVFA